MLKILQIKKSLCLILLLVPMFLIQNNFEVSFGQSIPNEPDESSTTVSNDNDQLSEETKNELPDVTSNISLIMTPDLPTLGIQSGEQPIDEISDVENNDNVQLINQSSLESITTSNTTNESTQSNVITPSDQGLGELMVLDNVTSENLTQQNMTTSESGNQSSMINTTLSLEDIASPDSSNGTETIFVNETVEAPAVNETVEAPAVNETVEAPAVNETVEAPAVTSENQSQEETNPFIDQIINPIQEFFGLK